jgi:hypothetical protein
VLVALATLVPLLVATAAEVSTVEEAEAEATGGEPPENTKMVRAKRIIAPVGVQVVPATATALK